MSKRPAGFLLTLTVAGMLLLCGCSSAEDPSGGAAPSGVAKQNAESFDGAGNTAANLLHDGIAAEYDGYVYHTDKMMRGGIWRTPSGGGESELVKKGTFHSINVSGGVIFAIGYVPDPDDDQLEVEGIVRVNIDAGGAELIKEGCFDELILYDNYLYYADLIEGGLYRVKTDGSDEKLMLEDVYENFAVVDGSIYVLTDNDNYDSCIYKLPLSGGKPELIFERTFGNYIDVALGGIYFISSDETTKNTFKYDVSAKKSQVSFDIWVNYLNTDGEFLYYFWNGVRMDNTDAGIYRSNADGSGRTLLLQIEECYSINIAGNLLFFHTNDDQRRLSVMNLDGTGLRFLPQAQD